MTNHRYGQTWLICLSLVSVGASSSGEEFVNESSLCEAKVCNGHILVLSGKGFLMKTCHSSKSSSGIHDFHLLNSADISCISPRLSSGGTSSGVEVKSGTAWDTYVRVDRRQLLHFALC